MGAKEVVQVLLQNLSQSTFLEKCDLGILKPPG
jgi:hypothetical protein